MTHLFIGIVIGNALTVFFQALKVCFQNKKSRKSESKKHCKCDQNGKNRDLKKEKDDMDFLTEKAIISNFWSYDGDAQEDPKEMAEKEYYKRMGGVRKNV